MILEDNGNGFHLHAYDTIQRSGFTADQTILFHALFQSSLNEDPIVHYDERFATPLLVFS